MAGERETIVSRLDDAGRAVFAERVARALGLDQTLTGPAATHYTPQGQTPAVVARPADVEGVQVAMALAYEAGATVTPWGSGSRQALGFPPERCDLVISLERLNRVVAYDPADLTITIQAGVTHAALAAVLAPEGQMAPLDPPLPARATLGGTLATGISGLRGALYGEPRDLVLGLRVVDVTGEMTRAGGAVVKNATGYGMRRVYTGSLGALGIITEASFKLLPAPETEATVIAACSSAHQAWEAAKRATQLATRPATVAAFHTDAIPELARRAPQREGEALLAIRLPGVALAVTRAIASLRQALTEVGAQTLLTLDEVTGGILWASVNDIPALRTAPREALARVATLPSETMSALDVAQSLATRHDLTLRWLADLQAGTLWLRLWAPEHTLSASSAAFTDALRDTLDTLGGRWPHTVLLAGSSVSTEEMPVWGADPEGLPLMREIKRRFDPGRLLNPGRLVGRL